MPLQKTSITLDSTTRSSLESLYPSLSISDIIRLCMEYTLKRKPKLILHAARLEEEKGEAENAHI